MGSSCSCDDPNATAQAEPDTLSKQPERRTAGIKSQKVDVSSDSEFESDEFDMDAQSMEEASFNNIETSMSSVEQQKAKNGFMNAIKSGNESLAIHFVNEYRSMNLVNLIFEAEENETNHKKNIDEGDNCLQVAVRNLSYKLIVFLLQDGGLSPNQQNQTNGETALHTAVRTRDVRLVALLSKYGADAQITNKKYETALKLASDNNDDDIVELLRSDTQEIIRDRLMSVAPTEKSAEDNNASAKTLPQFEFESEAIIETNDETDAYLSQHQAQKSDDRTFDQKLNAQQTLQMNALRVGRLNPFSKLKRNNTRKALTEMEKIAGEKDNLPKLEAWLEKKQNSIPYQWQKWWVVVKGSYILWSDIQRKLNDAKNASERKKFNNSINILAITSIEPVKKGKSQRKFSILMHVGKKEDKNKHKEYIWKCATKGDRDHWVKGLNKHITHIKSLITYLGNKN